MNRLAVISVLAALLLFPASSSALIEVYGNGHGSYLGGDAKHSYFANNDAGLGYGFTLGVEALMLDAFLDANFHPAGSQWNQIGLGFDIDVMPGDIFIEPTAQVLYFFGKQEGDADSIRGLFARAGAQAGIEFLTFLYAGVEAYAGYLVSLPDPEAGFAYMGSAFLGVRLGL